MIRLEDLGAPVQKLLQSIKEYDDEDMVLLSWIRVKDMAKIYEDMAAGRAAAMVWQELKANLAERREKEDKDKEEIDRQKVDLTERIADLTAKGKDAEDATQQDAEDAPPKGVAAEEEGEKIITQERKDKRAKKRQKELLRLQQEQEELEEKDAEAKRKRKEQKKFNKQQKKEWEKYVKDHPLLFDASKHHVTIEQDPVEELTKPPPTTGTKGIGGFMYTPQCPNCHAKYSKPPPRWDCPMCDRKFNVKVKCWQPDLDKCQISEVSLGRFTRHHCRNCGRVVSAKCSDYKAMLPALEFDGPQRVCIQCLEFLAPDDFAKIKEEEAQKAGKGMLARLKK